MQSDKLHTQSPTLFEQMPREIQEVLRQFEEIYLASIRSVAPTIVKATELLGRQTAKQVRPLLLLLTAHCFGPITEEIIKGSTVIELLHVSTLVHDDVIDESGHRRGVPSMNAVFDNRKAVLIGDYLLANAMTQAIQTNNKQILLQLATLGKKLSEGELLQMDTAELGDYSEERYLEIIDRKTASLIESSMLVGALLGGVKDLATLKAIEQIGQLLGRAFQIRDDIFDYQPTAQLGKPFGQDIAEHKVTLPLIYALQQESKERDKVLKLLRHEQLKRGEIAFVIDFATRMGGIEYATKKMVEMVEEAKQIIASTLPTCESRDALIAVANYIATRNK
ncbi:polyprenyl synthetase family protein [uncultured Porphyromonas sp.]|uniref:polyprenyl synthetase family protein n=1 Tax=uncultured Porphyromonas sp. TaxID=159274 RepID=UPI0005DAD9AC|nr:polyprenyl synthetase family protein [uncultured Porphyromonas sp.]CQB86623.1 geranylgeranyl pyrophosphate synthase [Chlamydia trachomatis]